MAAIGTAQSTTIVSRLAAAPMYTNVTMNVLVRSAPLPSRRAATPATGRETPVQAPSRVVTAAPVQITSASTIQVSAAVSRRS